MSVGESAPQAGTDAYAVSLPDPSVEALPAGSSLLIEGPALVGKRDVALDVLAGEDPAIAVTADDSATRLLDAFGERGGDRDRLWVVDCSGSSGKSGLENTDRVEYVSAPDDLTGIGIGVAKATRRIGVDATGGLRMGLLSLSTVLQYAGSERLFNFLHVMTGRIAAGDYLGVGTFDPTAHGNETVNVVRSQFDGVLQLQEDDDGRRARLRGLGGSREWIDF